MHEEALCASALAARAQGRCGQTSQGNVHSEGAVAASFPILCACLGTELLPLSEGFRAQAVSAYMARATVFSLHNLPNCPLLQSKWGTILDEVRGPVMRAGHTHPLQC